MKLMTKDQGKRLLKNGAANAARMAEGEDVIDHRPVVKLFTPDANATCFCPRLPSCVANSVCP